MRKATLFKIVDSLRTSLITLMCILGLFSSQAQTADCPPLGVFCQDLHTAFMPDTCMVQVWAKDFVAKINDGSESLESFGISFERDRLVMNREFTSLDGNRIEDIRIYINNGCDTTVCIVNLDINDNDLLNPCIQVCPFEPNPFCGFALVTCSARGTSPGGRIIDLRKNR